MKETHSPFDFVFTDDNFEDESVENRSAPEQACYCWNVVLVETSTQFQGLEVIEGMLYAREVIVLRQNL